MAVPPAPPEFSVSAENAGSRPAWAGALVSFIGDHES